MRVCIVVRNFQCTVAAENIELSFLPGGGCQQQRNDISSENKSKASEII